MAGDLTQNVTLVSFPCAARAFKGTARLLMSPRGALGTARVEFGSAWVDHMRPTYLRLLPCCSKLCFPAAALPSLAITTSFSELAIAVWLRVAKAIGTATE